MRQTAYAFTLALALDAICLEVITGFIALASPSWASLDYTRPDGVRETAYFGLWQTCFDDGGGNECVSVDDSTDTTNPSQLPITEPMWHRITALRVLVCIIAFLSVLVLAGAGLQILTIRREQRLPPRQVSTTLALAQVLMLICTVAVMALFSQVLDEANDALQATDPTRPEDEEYGLAYGFFGVVFSFLGALAGIGLVAGARHYADKAPHEEMSSLMPSPGASAPDAGHVRVLPGAAQREAPSRVVRSAFEAMGQQPTSAGADPLAHTSAEHAGEAVGTTNYGT